MSARNMAKRTAAGTLALAVCLGGGALALAGAAQADANFKFDTRIAGDDRYETAIAASKAAFPTDGKTDNVVLVNGFATVDGLTASYLAGVANAPILYVSDKGADDKTKAEIKRLGAKNVWLVGGEKVIPASVEAAIKGDGYTVKRINGEDRYETAKLIAEAGAKIAGKQPAKVFVASGTSFADALAVSPIAYAKGYAIALTEKDSTSDFTKKELGNIGSDTKILVGGTAVVSDKVAKDLTVSTRVAGDDRAVTANLVSDWAKKSEGFNPANAALVGGTNGNGADSLVASALGAKSFTTLHFAGWDATNVYLKDHAAELTGKGFVFGGKAAVSGDQVDKAQAAAQSAAAVVSNAVYSVTGNKGLVVTSGVASRQYQASVASGTRVKIVLVAKDSVAVINGKTYFKAVSASSDFLTAGTVSNVAITQVDGVTTSGTAADATSGGTVNFTVTGSGAADVFPVIFANAASGGDDKLALKSGSDDYRLPAEDFGVGGELVSVAAQQSDNSTTIGTVTGLDKDLKFFGTSAGTFMYKSGDTYRYNGVAITQTQFEGLLSSGDIIAGTYRQGSTNASTFNVTTDAIGTLSQPDQAPNGASVALLAVKTVDGSGARNDVVLNWKALQADAKYDVYRSTSNSPTITDGVDIKIASDLTATSYTALNENGTFYYKVVAKGGYSNQVATTWVSAQTAVPATAAAAPQVTGNILVPTNASNFASLSSGDVFKVTFDKDMAAPAADGTIRVQDSDGTVVTLTNGANATFALNTSSETAGAAKRVLTVTLTGTPTVSFAGTTAGLQFGATTKLVGATGIVESVDGTAYTPGSGDVLNLPAAYVTGAKVVNAASGTAGFGNDVNDQLVVTYSSPVTQGATTSGITTAQLRSATGINASDFADGSGGSPVALAASSSVSADGLTVTYTVTTAASAGTTPPVVLIAGKQVPGAAGTPLVVGPSAVATTANPTSIPVTTN